MHDGSSLRARINESWSSCALVRSLSMTTESAPRDCARFDKLQESSLGYFDKTSIKVCVKRIVRSSGVWWPVKPEEAHSYRQTVQRVPIYCHRRRPLTW